MTELSFLLELLLNHKLPRLTKDLIAERIKEVEASYSPARRIPTQTVQAIAGVPQAASTIAAMERQAIEAPVAVVAQTAATQAALASRATAIAEAIAGKVNKETGRPRKF